MFRTIVLMIICALAALAPAADKPVPAAVTKARDATACLQSAHGASSGFLVWRDKTKGVIATTCHGIADAINANVPITARFAGAGAQEPALAVTVLSCDLERDVAFLAVTSERLPQPLKLDGREKLQASATLWICGFPPPGAAGKAEVSAAAIEAVTLAAVRLDQRKVVERLQLGADLKRSFSGAPLLTAKGEAVGVAYQDFSSQGEGLAIPIAHVEEALAGRISHVDVAARFFGELEIDVTSRLIDPLGNITKVTCLAAVFDTPDWDKVTKAPDDPKGPSVSGMAESPMTYLDQWASGTAKVKRAKLADRTVIQIAVERKEGKRFYSKPQFSAANLYHPGRVDVAIVGKGELHGPLVQSTYTAPVVKVVEVPGREFLPATIERDETGHAYVALSSHGEYLTIDAGVTAFASHPSGSEVYIAFKQPLCLRVFDPQTWAMKAEIPLPGYPVDVWADGTTVAVSCASAQQIVLIDPGERRITASATIPRYADMFPARVLGRAPDGSLMSVWNRDEEGQFRRRWQREAIWDAQDRGLNALVHTVSDGTSRVMINGEGFSGGVWRRDGKGIIGESRTSVDLIFPNGSPADLELVGAQMNFYGPDVAFGGHCGLFVTLRDGSWILYPRHQSSGGGIPWTFRIAPMADRIAAGFPGEAICEVPDQGMIFSTGLGPINSSKTVYDNDSGYCYYVSSTDFTIQRRIRVFSPKGDLQKRNKKLRSGVRYVPGHELMLVPADLSNGKAGGIICYRCGPVDPAVIKNMGP